MNDIFESFLHQVVLERFAHATPMDLRKIFIKFIRHYEDKLEVNTYKYFSPLEVYWTINSVSLCLLYYMLVTEKYFRMIQEQYEASLQKRGITMHDYIEAMVKMKTSGLDITVLILCQMFQLSCVVLIDDYMWKSVDIKIEDFDVYLLMYKGGRFVSTTRNDGSKILLPIPKCAETVIADHLDPCIFRNTQAASASGNESEDQSLESHSQQLNNSDIMIATSDAFFSNYKLKITINN